MHILIADDEKAARYGIARALSSGNYRLTEAATGRETLDAMRTLQPDLVFLDLNMPDVDGQGVLREIGTSTTSEIVVVTANDSVAAAVECLQLGAADYVTKPFEIERLRALARRQAQRCALQRRVVDARGEAQQTFGGLVGSSTPMRDLYRQLELAAQSSLPILIRGETGTGKELIAREIHRLSARAPRPFVAVNTAAIAASLTESELFGHVRGAFTGADANHAGVFEQAHTGTLFLDEIGDMPLPAQAKILRTLQERVVRPIGSARPLAVDVRVISATHQDLDRAIADGRFRQDLYFRIKGIELRVPPLRARREDIILLADHFLEGLGGKRQLAADAIDRLLAYSWPGNVRELEHVIASAAALSSHEVLRAADLRLPRQQLPAEEPNLPALLDLPLMDGKNRLVEWFERTCIKTALEQHGGNVSAAARQLGMHRQSLQQKMTQLGLQRP